MLAVIASAIVVACSSSTGSWPGAALPCPSECNASAAACCFQPKLAARTADGGTVVGGDAGPTFCLDAATDRDLVTLEDGATAVCSPIGL